LLGDLEIRRIWNSANENVTSAELKIWVPKVPSTSPFATAIFSWKPHHIMLDAAEIVIVSMSTRNWSPSSFLMSAVKTVILDVGKKLTDRHHLGCRLILFADRHQFGCRLLRSASWMSARNWKAFIVLDVGLYYLKTVIAWMSVVVVCFVAEQLTKEIWIPAMSTIVGGLRIVLYLEESSKKL
jgi:hypothetical protein